MTMRKFAIMTAAVLVIAGCGSRGAKNAPAEDLTEIGKTAYSDLVSFICQGYQSGWDAMSPEDQGLSQVYSYSSEYAGFAEQDINGDGIPELLIGDQFEDGGYFLYDIYTINPADGSLIHLAKGGERDTFKINGDGIIIEDGSNSAFDSFRKAFKIEGGKLAELEDDNAGWEDSLMKLELNKFAGMAVQHLTGAFGDQREITEEEMEMFKALTEDGDMVLTPLSVSTQVVAGTNYKFWCRYGQKEPEERSGHCWVTVFKPLPGRGEPSVTSIEKAEDE